MKKVLLAAFLIAALFFGSKTVNAQTGSAIKVGYFDIDLMVQTLPEYRTADSLTQLYERDSLNTEYQLYVDEYQRLDSTLKADSAAKKPKSVLDFTNNQKQQMALQLTYWQQIAQNKSNQYRSQLLQPAYQKILVAYKKVLAEKKYTLVLKPDAIEIGSFSAENVFPFVAKEMNVTLPPGLAVDINSPLQGSGTGTPVPRAGTGKP